MRRIFVQAAALVVIVAALAYPGSGLETAKGQERKGREVTVTVFVTVRALAEYDYTLTAPFDKKQKGLGTVHKTGHFRDNCFAQGWGETKYRVEGIENNIPFLEEVENWGQGIFSGGGDQKDTYTYTSDFGSQSSSYKASWSYAAKPPEDKDTPTGPTINTEGDDKTTDVVVGFPRNFPSVHKSTGRGAYRTGQGTGHYNQTRGVGPELVDRVVGEALYQDKDFKENLLIKVDWSKPVFVTRSASLTWDGKKHGLVNWGSNVFNELLPEGNGTQWATLDVTWTVSDKGLMPAVLDMIPQPGFDQWQPVAGTDERTPGNKVLVQLDLHKFGQPGVPPDEKVKKLTVSLINTSKEKGVCMNAPSDKKSKREFDLRIKSADPLKVDKDGQRAEGRDPPTQLDVELECYDWGAYSELTATAELANGRVVVGRVRGHVDRAQLVIPQDNNHNHVADAWEKDTGVYEKNYPADWDGAKVAGQSKDGDGITLFEKYRGFRTSLGHQRLRPDRKYLFLFDPADAAKRSGGLDLFGRASQIATIVLNNEDHWTGHGSSSGEKRIVNFNHGHGHKSAQHALDFVEDPSMQENAPRGWTALQTQKNIPSTPLTDHVFGRTFPDGVADDAVTSPADAYQVTVFPKMIRADIWSIGETCMTQTHQADPAQALKDFDKARPNQYPTSIAWQTKVTVAHEIGHGVGAPHHAGECDGNRQCVMRYPDALDSSWNAADPFWNERYKPTPFAFCTDSLTVKKQGCMSNIQVSDHRGK